MKWFFTLILIINIHSYKTSYTDKQYASLPELFHQDNFDKCMLLRDEALYCSFEYHLEPIKPENPTWTTIQEIIVNNYNYRHDILRHWICVPFTCPNSTGNIKNTDELTRNIKDCYDQKMKHYKLKGNVSNLKCITEVPKYPVNWLDAATAIIILGYISTIIIITLTEMIAKRWWSEEYRKLENTFWGKVIGSFSITKNWCRLTTIKYTEELKYLQPLQGVRSLNSFLVIFSHTCIAAVMLPVTNTNYVETVSSKNSNLFLSSGPLAVSTFFLISSILLSYGIFKNFEHRELTPKTLLVAFINRYIRLTPAMAVVILFNATWWRHLGNGPNWYNLIGKEYKRCRKNWWTNLLYLNTVIDPYNMCTPTFWYIAEDTQYFIMLLVLLWFIKRHEKRIWCILGSLLSLIMVATFVNNYVNDFEAINVPRAEAIYNMKNIVDNPLWQGQFISTIANTSGSIIGVGFGYLFYKTRYVKVFTERENMWKVLFYFLSYLPGLATVIIPSWYVMIAKYEHDAFVSSFIVAIGRPIFALAIGYLLFSCIQGIAGPTDKVVRWTPIYILGRVAYGAYLVHFTLILSRAAVARTPTYVNDALIFHTFLGDLAASYMIGCLITLIFEMPISALQKLLIPTFTTRSEKDR